MSFRPDPIASVLVFGLCLIGSNVFLRAVPYTPPVLGEDRVWCSPCTVTVPPALTPQEVRELAKPPALVLSCDGAGKGQVLIALGRKNMDLVPDVRAAIVVARRAGLTPRIEVSEVDALYWRSRLVDLLPGGGESLEVRPLSAAGTVPYIVYRGHKGGFRQIARKPQEVLPNVVFRLTRLDEPRGDVKPS